MSELNLRELWNDIAFALCFAIPMRFVSEYEVGYAVGSAFWIETTRHTWWQWRDHVWSSKITKGKVY